MNKRDNSLKELSCGCGHCLSLKNERKTKDNNFMIKDFAPLFKICFSLAFFIVAFFVAERVGLILFICSGLIAGYELILNFFKNLIEFNFFNENTLMLIASITAYILGEYFEGALILILFIVGEFLEKLATKNSKKKISGLSKLKILVAHLITKDGVYDLSPEEITVGSLIEVKSGEAVPIDGVLIGQPTELDMKAITGESKYAVVNNGGIVYSGAINVGNPIVIKTTKNYKDSTVENIIAMVEGSLSQKAKSQKFITGFSKFYTPIIFSLAILIALLPPFFDQMNFIKWVYKGLSFLVISCPCALVISIPLSFFIGIGGLARHGVLVKGSKYLESITKADSVVFDKTGTLTHGNFVIDKIECFNGFIKEQALAYAICLEKKSNHPIASAFKKYNQKFGIDCKEVKEIAGKGIIGYIEGLKICLGSEKLMLDSLITVRDNFAGTILYMSINGVLAAKLYLVDEIKENAYSVIKSLKKLGIKETIILSGDNQSVVNYVANRIDVDSFYSNLLPSDKVDVLNALRANDKKIVYVGDGINDSPSLALADVGIAMGGLGSEIATNSSDIVIMDDNLSKIPLTIKHAKKVKRIVAQNIIGSLGVKISIMLLSLAITMPVWVAMLADVGVMLLAILNSFRVSRVKK